MWSNRGFRFVTPEAKDLQGTFPLKKKLTLQTSCSVFISKKPTMPYTSRFPKEFPPTLTLVTPTGLNTILLHMIVENINCSSFCEENLHLTFAKQAKKVHAVTAAL